jgi:hypothetical protein
MSFLTKIFKSKEEREEEKKNIEEIYELEREIKNLEKIKRVVDKNIIINGLIKYEDELSKNIRLKQFPIRIKKLILLKKKSLLEKLKNSNLYNSNSPTKYMKNFHPEIIQQNSAVKGNTTKQNSAIKGNTTNLSNKSSTVVNPQNSVVKGNITNLSNKSSTVVNPQNSGVKGNTLNLFINQLNSHYNKIYNFNKTEKKKKGNDFKKFVRSSITKNNEINKLLKLGTIIKQKKIVKGMNGRDREIEENVSSLTKEQQLKIREYIARKYTERFTKYYQNKV